AGYAFRGRGGEEKLDVRAGKDNGPNVPAQDHHVTSLEGPLLADQEGANLGQPGNAGKLPGDGRVGRLAGDVATVDHDQRRPGRRISRGVDRDAQAFDRVLQPGTVVALGPIRIPSRASTRSPRAPHSRLTSRLRPSWSTLRTRVCSSAPSAPSITSSPMGANRSAPMAIPSCGRRIASATGRPEISTRYSFSTW